MRQATKPTGPRIIIPIGSVFEKWTVIGAPEPAKEVYGLYVYPCRCECGNIGKVRAIYLTKNLSSRCQECGPRDAGKATKQYKKDFTGQTFGKWKVLRRIASEERRQRNEALPPEQQIHLNEAWLCRCECGIERIMATSDFRRHESCWECRPKDKPTLRTRPFEAVFNLMRNAVLRRLGGRRHHEFTISYEEFAEIAQTGKCHYCHEPISFVRHGKTKANHAYRVDRKDNSKGYVSGNVCACCKRCNFSKGDRYTYEEWFIMTRCYRSGRLPRSTVKFGGFGCREQRCKS